MAIRHLVDFVAILHYYFFKRDKDEMRDGRTFVAPKMKHLQGKVRLDSESSRKSCTLTEGRKRRGERVV